MSRSFHDCSSTFHNFATLWPQFWQEHSSIAACSCHVLGMLGDLEYGCMIRREHIRFLCYFQKILLTFYFIEYYYIPYFLMRMGMLAHVCELLCVSACMHAFVFVCVDICLWKYYSPLLCWLLLLELTLVNAQSSSSVINVLFYHIYLKHVRTLYTLVFLFVVLHKWFSKRVRQSILSSL